MRTTKLRGVVIAHASAGVRMRLASALIGGRPVLLAAEIGGVLAHLALVARGRAPGPVAIVLCESERERLVGSDAWARAEAEGSVLVCVRRGEPLDDLCDQLEAA